MEIFDPMSRSGQGQMSMGTDSAVDLNAIHGSPLGPACGGALIRLHKTERAAFRDVLLLPAAMTCKAATTGLSPGGGKSVIVAEPPTHRSEALLRASERYLTVTDPGRTGLECNMFIGRKS